VTIDEDLSDNQTSSEEDHEEEDEMGLNYEAISDDEDFEESSFHDRQSKNADESEMSYYEDISDDDSFDDSNPYDNISRPTFEASEPDQIQSPSPDPTSCSEETVQDLDHRNLTPTLELTFEASELDETQSSSPDPTSCSEQTVQDLDDRNLTPTLELTYEASEPYQIQSPSTDVNSLSCSEDVVHNPDVRISTSSMEISEGGETSSFEEKVEVSTSTFEDAETGSPPTDTKSSFCSEETFQDPVKSISMSCLEASETGQVTSFEEKLQNSVSNFEVAETEQFQSQSTSTDLTPVPCYYQISNEEISTLRFEEKESNQAVSSFIFKDITSETEIIPCFEGKNLCPTHENPSSTAKFDQTLSSSISPDRKLSSLEIRHQSSREEKPNDEEKVRIEDISTTSFEAEKSDLILSSELCSDDKLVSPFEDTNQDSSESKFTSIEESEVPDQIEANLSDLPDDRVRLCFESTASEQISGSLSFSHLTGESFQTHIEFCDSVTCLQDVLCSSTPNFADQIRIPFESTNREDRKIDDVIVLAPCFHDEEDVSSNSFSPTLSKLVPDTNYNATSASLYDDVISCYDEVSDDDDVPEMSSEANNNLKSGEICCKSQEIQNYFSCFKTRTETNPTSFKRPVYAMKLCCVPEVVEQLVAEQLFFQSCLHNVLSRSSGCHLEEILFQTFKKEEDFGQSQTSDEFLTCNKSEECQTQTENFQMDDSLAASGDNFKEQYSIEEENKIQLSETKHDDFSTTSDNHFEEQCSVSLEEENTQKNGNLLSDNVLVPASGKIFEEQNDSPSFEKETTSDQVRTGGKGENLKSITFEKEKILSKVGAVKRKRLDQITTSAEKKSKQSETENNEYKLFVSLLQSKQVWPWNKLLLSDVFVGNHLQNAEHQSEEQDQEMAEDDDSAEMHVGNDQIRSGDHILIDDRELAPNQTLLPLQHQQELLKQQQQQQQQRARQNVNIKIAETEPEKQENRLETKNVRLYCDNYLTKSGGQDFKQSNFNLSLKQQQQQQDKNEKRRKVHSKEGKPFRFEPYNEKQRRQLQSRTSSVHPNKLKNDYLYEQQSILENYVKFNYAPVNKKYETYFYLFVIMIATS